MKLTKEFLVNHPDFTTRYISGRNSEEYELYFESKDKRIEVRQWANLSQDAWNIHVDNEDFDTIACFDVETVEDANKILSVYNLYI